MPSLVDIVADAKSGYRQGSSRTLGEVQGFTFEVLNGRLCYQQGSGPWTSRGLVYSIAITDGLSGSQLQSLIDTVRVKLAPAAEDERPYVEQVWHTVAP